MMGQPWPTQYKEDDPRRYTSDIKVKLGDLVDRMRQGERAVNDARAKALLETGAEVLSGLKKAYEDYEAGFEAAWR